MFKVIKFKDNLQIGTHTATQALEHEYLRLKPLPGRNALVPPRQSREKVVNYPTHPVDQKTYFEGTTSIQSSQALSSRNAVADNMGSSDAGRNESVNRPMPLPPMQTMPLGMMAYNFSSQQQQLRRKHQGIGMSGYSP
ncbi:hypothetical protein GOBAR_AA13752 [Gossypium barbadense]|uniref:Protein kinase domain-containing protein n=1 Tax=Gossypium barbadense TaxID=3634 RepID=A0A2P5XU73_GOSBA|nr:hypothetical protein GOBAR_AA13752 [Gossypium barbadense]